MTEWAQQAGKLAFDEIESFSNDLVATFLNLTLFWHSQGSWKLSSLYKGENWQASEFHTCSHHLSQCVSIALHSWYWKHPATEDPNFRGRSPASSFLVMVHYALPQH